jgi:uncharacterized protein YndB with AHSA1/START domain
MATGPDGLTLELTRTLPVAPALAFEAFTDPGRLARWWGPTGFSVPRLDFVPRVGETYRIEMQPPEGDAFYLTGAFREVDPPARLAYTFAWEGPDPDDVETLVDISFRGHGESTEVRVTQSPFATEARLALHEGGWAESLDRLEALLSSPA